jgi:hypothetical protein
LHYFGRPGLPMPILPNRAIQALTSASCSTLPSPAELAPPFLPDLTEPGRT